MYINLLYLNRVIPIHLLPILYHPKKPMNIYQQKKQQHIRTWPTHQDESDLRHHRPTNPGRQCSTLQVEVPSSRANLPRKGTAPEFFLSPETKIHGWVPAVGCIGLQRGGKERCWKKNIYIHILVTCVTWQPLWKYRVINFVFVIVLLSIDHLVHYLLIITEMVRMLPKRLVKPTGVRTMYSIETGIKQTWNDSEAFPNLSRKIIYLETWPIQETKAWEH